MKVVFEEDVVAVVGVRALDVIVALVVTVYILFFFLVVCYPKLFSVVVTNTSVSQKTSKKKKKNKAKKTKEEQTRDKKQTQKKQDQRDHLIRKDLKVLSSEEGERGSLSVVISSNDDAQPVVF